MPRHEDRHGSSTRLYVGRLSSRTRSRDLEDIFSKYGRVRDVDMKRDYAFVEFSDTRDADDARYGLNGRDVDGSHITVEFAKGNLCDKKSVPGSRQLNLKKSFKRGLRSLLTACSLEEFRKAFPSFTATEQEHLHRLFIQVITSVHEDIEEEVESMFLETKVGPILDHVEELVEEHNLDPLVPMKSSVGETAQNLSEAKKKELQYLTGLLKKAEEQKRNLSERLEVLKKEKKDISGAADLVHEVADSLGKGTEHEDEYMISEKELLVNRFISIPKDMGAFNCGAFVAGVVRGVLDNAGFPAVVTAHFVPVDGQQRPRTTILIKFAEEVLQREARLG